jgi:hypothetical protein
LRNTKVGDLLYLSFSSSLYREATFSWYRVNKKVLYGSFQTPEGYYPSINRELNGLVHEIYIVGSNVMPVKIKKCGDE